MNANCIFFEKDCNLLLGDEKRKRSSNFLNEFCAGEEKTTCSSFRTSRGIYDDFLLKGEEEVDGTPYIRQEGWGNY